MLSPDIIAIITSYLDWKSTMNLYMTCRSFYNIWLQTKPFTRIVNNNKDFDDAIKDPTCCLIYLNALWTCPNNLTSIYSIPLRDIHIIGLGTNHFTAKWNTADTRNRRITISNVILSLNITAPAWDITISDCQISYFNIKCRQLLFHHSGSNSDKVYITADKTWISSLSSTDTPALWQIHSDYIDINRLVFRDTFLSLTGHDINIHNSYFSDEQYALIDFELPSDNIRISNCLFKSSYSGIPYANRIKIYSTSLLICHDNKLLTADGKEFTDSNDIFIRFEYSLLVYDDL